MSYYNMDHAGWVESNNAAGRRQQKKPTKFEGRVVGYHAAPEKLTPFQARVMDILGSMLGGIYNAGITWETVDWNLGTEWTPGVGVVVRTGRGLATYDFDTLTQFVFLCHSARIRGDISAAGPGRWRMMFWQRTATGGMSDRHPSLQEAVSRYLDILPADSNIRWTPVMDELLWDDRAKSRFPSYAKEPFDADKHGYPLLAKVREILVSGGGNKELKELFPEPEPAAAG